MSRRQPRRDQPDRETQLDDQEEQQAHAAASGPAMQAAFDQWEHNRQDFVEKLQSPDFSGDDATAVEEELGTLFAGIYPLANEDENEFRYHKWTGRNKTERIRSARNPGRLCSQPFYQLATGTHLRPDEGAVRPFTQRERRQIADAIDAKLAMHSLGDGEGLSAISEITAVSRHERETDPETDDGGNIIGRIFS